ncbi:hypothetical protein LshimejAT787_0405900 [Lyophyllum shimeji]|uniref:Uncharacterized protein n=1 Tax=Lyophyllum shimeji TaxID=47721 RepID=A0A9P3UK13_LYOSH|nr:hypothetical protein LshimejAT787_0405900 [Lyophyllum shimeji]
MRACIFSGAIAITALSAFVSAQSLSSACTNALLAVATNPDASVCLSLNSLIPVVTGSTNVSIVPVFDTWLTSICAAALCSNETLSAVATNVSNGCAAELALPDTSTTFSSGLAAVVQQFYPTVRKMFCLKDGDTYCITQTLSSIENIVGPLKIFNIIQLALNPGVYRIPPNITCADCIKEAYNIVSHDIPSLVSDTGPSLQSQCGTSFTDGSTPSGISESAVEATKSASAALGAVPPGTAGAGVGVVVASLVTATSVLLFFA